MCTKASNCEEHLQISEHHIKAMEDIRHTHQTMYTQLEYAAAAGTKHSTKKPVTTMLNLPLEMYSFTL